MAMSTNAQLMFKNNILQQTQKHMKIDQSHNYQHILHLMAGNILSNCPFIGQSKRQSKLAKCIRLNRC